MLADSCAQGIPEALRLGLGSCEGQAPRVAVSPPVLCLSPWAICLAPALGHGGPLLRDCSGQGAVEEPVRPFPPSFRASRQVSEGKGAQLGLGCQPSLRAPKLQRGRWG